MKFPAATAVVSIGAEMAMGGTPELEEKGARAHADVVELIKNDHREVERLFDLLKNQPATRGLNFPVLVPCSLRILEPRRPRSTRLPRHEAGETEGGRAQPGRARRG